MLDATLSRLVNQRYNSFASHEGVASQGPDGSTVEMLAWDLWTRPSCFKYIALYERLLTTTGGYRRLEPNLS